MVLRRLTKATVALCLSAGVAHGQQAPAQQASPPPETPAQQPEQVMLAPGFYTASPPVSEPPAGFLGSAPGTFPAPTPQAQPPQPPRQPMPPAQPPQQRMPPPMQRPLPPAAMGPQAMPPPLPRGPSHGPMPEPLSPMGPEVREPGAALPPPMQRPLPPAAMGPQGMQPPLPRGPSHGPGPMPEPLSPTGAEVREPGGPPPPQPGAPSDEMGSSPEGLAQGQPYPAFEGEQTQQPHVLVGSVVRVADEAVQVKVGQRVVELLLTPGTLVVKGNARASLEALPPGTEVRAHYVVTEGTRVATRLQVAAPGAPLPKPAAKPAK